MWNNRDLHFEYIHTPISVQGKSTNCSSNWGDMRWLDGRAYAFNIFQVHIVVNVIMCLVALVSVGMRLRVCLCSFYRALHHRGTPSNLL
jgi:hypothetical protein